MNEERARFQAHVCAALFVLGVAALPFVCLRPAHAHQVVPRYVAIHVTVPVTGRPSPVELDLRLETVSGAEHGHVAFRDGTVHSFYAPASQWIVTSTSVSTTCTDRWEGQVCTFPISVSIGRNATTFTIGEQAPHALAQSQTYSTSDSQVEIHTGG